MKILKIILITIGSFVLAYCLTAFFYADFNFKNWSFQGRLFTDLLGFTFAGFGIFTIIFYDIMNR